MHPSFNGHSRHTRRSILSPWSPWTVTPIPTTTRGTDIQRKIIHKSLRCFSGWICHLGQASWQTIGLQIFHSSLQPGEESFVLVCGKNVSLAVFYLNLGRLSLPFFWQSLCQHVSTFLHPHPVQYPLRVASERWWQKIDRLIFKFAFDAVSVLWKGLVKF